jgi:hypothetical protein
MTKPLRAAVLCAGLAMSLGCGYLYLCAAQQFKQVPPAPVPPLILAAKKVFIANGGGDESLFDMPQYSGGPDRLYNEFYAAMKSWGRYELVSTARVTSRPGVPGLGGLASATRGLQKLVREFERNPGEMPQAARR